MQHFKEFCQQALTSSIKKKKKLKNLTTANFIVDYDMACQRALFLGLFRDRSLFNA